MKLKLVVLVVLVAIGVGALAVTLGGLGANGRRQHGVPHRRRDRR